MNKFKNYSEAREYTASLVSRGIAPGLETIGALCEALGNPQDKIKTIHIAGTNGKGSIGTFISYILQADKKSVGRYVSPAVSEYREIIRINNEYISEFEYTDIISEVAAAINTLEKQGIYPTSFEAETAAAFLYFAKKGCDYALIECGMGGALDATNIIKCPAAAVFASISMDHMSFLGNTLSEIARNKSGIIKPGTEVFTSIQSDEVLEVIREKSSSENVRLHIAEVPRIKEETIKGTVFDYGDTKDVFIPLAGVYQPYNASVAIELCKTLGVDEAAIKQGLRDTKWSFRFEADKDGWIFDGAHNEDAARQLRGSVDTLLKGRKIAYIVGVFRDKAYDRMLEIMAPAADMIYTVKPPTDRGLDAAELAEAAAKYTDKVSAARDMTDAIRLCAAGKYDNVLVFGSLSFLAHIKQEKELIYEQMSEDN